jgi:WhiB family redox-sensing transcriptional regulator
VNTLTRRLFDSRVLLKPPGNWVFDAACGDHPELFYPPDSDLREDPDLKRKRVTKAKAICETCPVKQKCRQHAFDKGENYGIWGGIDMEVMRKAPKKGA